MILSFLPVLLGSRTPASETVKPSAPPPPATPEGGLGFGALFLALLGGGSVFLGGRRRRGARPQRRDGPDTPDDSASRRRPRAVRLQEGGTVRARDGPRWAGRATPDEVVTLRLDAQVALRREDAAHAAGRDEGDGR